MVPGRLRSRTVALLVAALIAAVSVHPLAAEVPADLAEPLVREIYKAIRDDALRPPDLLTLLNQTALAAQLALVSAGIGNPPPLPVFIGQEDNDFAAAAAYVQGAITAAPGESDRIMASVLRAMVRTVADPQGSVFTPAEFARYHRELEGKHPGIGVQVDAVRGQIVISDVTAGGPAARAGLRVGDAIVEIDGRSTEGSTPGQVLDRLRGDVGTPVLLIVRRVSGGTVRVPLPREVVRETPVRAKMVDARIGYLRLLEFTEGASSDLRRALGNLMDAGATALLLDLRENGGGLLDEAVVVASAFLSDGVVAMEERRGTLNPLAVVPQTRRFAGPVVVLVNVFTASASEVVAGALQDTGAPLVGQRTFGKATVQTIYPLPGGWGLRLTTARYYTRRGRSIDGQGLQPNVPVSMDEEQIQGPQDVQLREATTALRARLAAGTGTRP